MDYLLYKTAEETLESCGLTAEEFFKKVTIGNGCSGLTTFLKGCRGLTCSACPVNAERSENEIREWLNATASDIPKRTTNQRLDSLEEKLDTLINLLTSSKDRKEA